MAYDIRFRSSVSVREEGNMTVKTPASSDLPTHHLGHTRKPPKKPASSDPPTHNLRRRHKASKSPAPSVPPLYQLGYMDNLQSEYDFEAWKPCHEGT